MPFNYRRVSQELVRELRDKVSDGQSAVLLGPRYGGKRYVMDRVRALLCDSGIAPIMQIRLLAESPLCTSLSVTELIRKAAAGVDGLDPAGVPTDDPFELLELLAAQTEKPLVFFAANVDGMSHHLACRFLQKVRMLVTGKRLVVVMSGENNFRELVHGENSEFNCVNQYALQGYTFDEFDEFLGRYLRHLRIKFSDLDAASLRLWEITGGNLYILRVILWSIIQKRARTDSAPDAPVGVEEIPSTFKLTGIPGAYGSHIFRHATQLMARERPCWEELERLIEDGQMQVMPEDAPGRLELAGIAIKEIYGSHVTLKFSSPMMEAFVKRFYDARRFGDLYASVGRWDEAFERYNQLDPEERVRPSGTDDRAEVEATVGVLCSSLYAEVAAESRREEGILHAEAVRRLFARGCCYVLGFREITFWQRDTILGPAAWQHHQLDTAAPSDEVMNQIRKLLPEQRNLSPGILNLRGTLSRYAIAAVLPARLNKQAIVVVSDFTAGSVISQERKGLIRQVLEHFIGAYKHAIEVDNLQIQHRVQRMHEDIIGSIFDKLGTHDFNVHDVLTEAARGLRKLDYSRVLFCLVNKERTRIIGELDDSDDPLLNVAEMTDWPLDDPTADLQPYVVRNKEPKIIKDARKEPLANQKIVRDAGMRAEALLPILNRAEDVMGTIHIERADGGVPTREEVDSLMFFGRQLSIAIEQCERLNLIESALDKIPEPLMIVDVEVDEDEDRRYEYTRYKNQAASDFFGGAVGWSGRHSSPIDNLPATITEPLRDSLETGNRRATLLDGFNQDSNYRGQAITDIIQDWRKRTVAGLLRIQDLTYLYKYLEAPLLSAEAADANSAIHGMLEAIIQLGHKWGRLYLVRKAEDGVTDVFQSALCYGDGLEREAAEDFNIGMIILTPRSVKGHRDWLCIEQRRPVVFCWKDDLQDGKEYVTPHGISIMNWVNPRQHPLIRKRPGELWMDFPLIFHENILGKICLQIDENLRHEELAHLKKLSERFSGILAAKLQQDQNKGAREEMIRKSVADKTMATMAHNLGTRLGSLPVILDRYRYMAKKYKEIAHLNDEFADIIDYAQTTVKRANELLSPVKPRLKNVDVCETILRTLRLNLPPAAWELSCDENLPEMLLDVHLFDTALLELIRNSRDAAASPDEMLISIKVESSAQLGTEGVNITYRDNGPGIPAEYARRIFDDFFSYRPNRKAAGTGLGMGFVERVVIAHGGVIYYSSDILKSGHTGAEFTISLPRLAEAGLTEEATRVQNPDR